MLSEAAKNYYLARERHYRALAQSALDEASRRTHALLADCQAMQLQAIMQRGGVAA